MLLLMIRGLLERYLPTATADEFVLIVAKKSRERNYSCSLTAHFGTAKRADAGRCGQIREIAKHDRTA